MEKPYDKMSKKEIPVLRHTTIIIAIISGFFTFVIIGLLIFNYIQLKTSDPLNSIELEDLKSKLSIHPGDENIKQQIRAIDLRLRNEYFRRREFSKFGGYILIASISILLISIKYADINRRMLPDLGSKSDGYAEESRNVVLARWSVAAIGAIMAGSLLALVIGSERAPLSDFILTAEKIVAESVRRDSQRTDQKTSILEEEKASVSAPQAIVAQTATETVVTQLPSEDDIKKNWTRFRGPYGLGISAYDNIPLSYDGKTGKNILWKTKYTLPGEGSPVVWGKRVFLTGATESKREVYCFDADSGKILWQKSVENVPGSSPSPPKVTEDTGFAAPTPATDGQRVYAIFANGDVVSFDFGGNQVWARSLGVPRSVYGYASSLLIYKKLLLILYDQGGAEDNLSKLIAVDSLSGQTVWEAKRPVPNSWATPIVINTGTRDEVITSANPWIIAYDPNTGNEYWRAKCLSGDIAPSPIYAGGLVFATNAYAKLAAIKPGGQGDVTQTNIVWSATDGLPDICSPLSNGSLIFLLQTYGLLTCYDAKSGEIVWDNDLAETFKASPSLVGDKVYLLTEEGIMIIIKADRKFEEIGRCPLGEKSTSSPAFMDGRIYIRGKENLYCIAR